jgi:hypothetical protein
MLKHRFQSGKSDPLDTTLIRPSNWNDSHVISTLASDPSSPANGDTWFVDDGTTIYWRMRRNGVTVTLLTVTP